MSYEPSYTWRTAVRIFVLLLAMFVVVVGVGLLIAYGVDPLPYEDPEPPIAVTPDQ